MSTNHVASFLAPCVLSGLSRLSWLSLDSGSGWLSLSLIRERKELRARLQQFIGGGAVNAVSAAREQELIALNEDRQQLVHLQQLVLQLMGGQQLAAVATPPPPPVLCAGTAAPGSDGGYYGGVTFLTVVTYQLRTVRPEAVNAGRHLLTVAVFFIWREERGERGHQVVREIKCIFII